MLSWSSLSIQATISCFLQYFLLFYYFVTWKYYRNYYQHIHLEVYYLVQWYCMCSYEQQISRLLNANTILASWFSDCYRYNYGQKLLMKSPGTIITHYAIIVQIFRILYQYDIFHNRFSNYNRIARLKINTFIYKRNSSQTLLPIISYHF